MLRRSVIIVAIAFIFAAGPRSASAEDRVTEELKELNDPTILKSRLWLDYEWNDFKHGAADGEVLLGTLWAWGITPRQDWAVRLEIPFDWHLAGNTPGDQSGAGLGDIELATGTAFRLGEAWRTGGGLELHADTATNDTVGDGDWRLKPFWSIAWDPAKWLTFGFTAEYNHSIAEQTGVAPERYAEFYIPITFILPHAWSLTAQYKRKVDFEDGNRWTQKVKLAVAKRLANAPMSLSATIEKGLDGGEKEFEAHFIATWYF